MMKPPAGNKAAILGLGISGFASAVFLQSRGYSVFVSDQGQSPQIQEKARQLMALGIEVEIGAHSADRLADCDWMVISPGIPPSAPAVQSILQKKIPIYNDVEMASWFCASRNIIGVTGSSGKTTVTTLLGRVFQKWKGRVFVCGNIGTPWVSEIDRIQPEDFVVLELSSFQLRYCESFRPHIGLLLNLSPNHQDWHPNMEDYVQSKLRLFQAQEGDDFAIVRKSDQECYFQNFKFAGKVKYLDACQSLNSAVNPNEAAVRMVGEIAGCPSGVVEMVLRDFEGIEHRMEKVAFKDGIYYVNDSKSTTTASLEWALGKFQDKSVILIAGGHPKSDDFDKVRRWVERKVKKAVLIGEAKPLLRQAWQGACDFWETDDFRSAVFKAKEFAAAGDTVLLSPACASFDMFQNYIERGQMFKDYVHLITDSSASASLKSAEKVL